MKKEIAFFRLMDNLMDLFEQRGINYALWDWSPSYEIYTSEVNAFNFRFGPDPNNTTDVNSSELITVIRNYWSQNTHRPSNVNFEYHHCGLFDNCV